jgi:type II restriction enzyme
MTNTLKESIENTITECLRAKFRDYTPKNNCKPFQERLLGNDRLGLYSFIQSLNTTFGASVFEPVAVSLSQKRFAFAARQHVVGNEIYADCGEAVNQIMNDLEVSVRKPDRTDELSILRTALSGGKVKCKPAKADLFLIDKKGGQWIFDMKSPKPNKGEFTGFKRTLLSWSGIAMTKDPGADVHALLAITYNPNYPEPYQSWQMSGMLERDEMLVEKEFWDFLGGNGAYDALLQCFENAGNAMRDEIDGFFKRFS